MIIILVILLACDSNFIKSWSIATFGLLFVGLVYQLRHLQHVFLGRTSGWTA